MIKGLALKTVMPDPGAVLRSLLATVLMTGVAVHWGPAGSATAVAGSAVIAGATSLQDSPRRRILIVVGVALMSSAAVGIGALASAFSPAFVVVAVLWCFVAAIPWALGANAGLIAAATGALLVAAAPVHPTWASTVGTAALALVGGLLQATLIGLWPPRRWRTQRDALAAAYAALAAAAQRAAARGGDPLPGDVDTEPLIALREAFTVVDGQPRRRPASYRRWYALPERLAAALDDAGRRSALTDVLVAAGETLDAVADRRRSTRESTAAAIGRVDTAVDRVADADAPVAHRLSQLLHEAVAVRLGDFVPSSPEVVRVRRPQLRTSARAAADLMHRHLDRHSPVFRHAVRLSVTVGVACALERYSDIGHSSWIALTVLLVLRPETAHTYTRSVGRLAGTAVGVAAASVVLAIAGPGPAVTGLLAVVAVGITYAWASYGYVALSAGLASTAVLMIGIEPAGDAPTVAARLVGVVLGGVLAVLAHVMLPDDALTRLSQRAGELLKTEIDYAATVIKSHVHEMDRPADAMSTAWQRAYRSRAAFEAAAGATRMESSALRYWLRSYRTALNAITGSCTTLEEHLPVAPAAAGPAFVRAVDEYVESLCGDPPTPASPWTVDTAELAAADRRLRQAVVAESAKGSARVLASEVGTITHHLTAMAATPGPVQIR